MTNAKEKPVHVITSVERRRSWFAYEKKDIIGETYEPEQTVSSVARKYGVSPSQLFLWRRKMEEDALVGVGSEEQVIPESSYKQAIERIKRLERLLGQKTEEVDILKEAVRVGREKTYLAQTLAQQRRFSISSICRVLEVSRSSICTQLKQKKRSSKGREALEEDVLILQTIKDILRENSA